MSEKAEAWVEEWENRNNTPEGSWWWGQFLEEAFDAGVASEACPEGRDTECL